MTRSTHSPWIEFRTPRPHAMHRLFCFHGAGGAAHSFRSWSAALPASIEVCPLQLPGRLTRLHESPYTRVEPLVAAIVAAIEGDLDRPFAFFGHSFGTLLAFETARALRRRGLPSPRHLFVAARIAPHVSYEPLSAHALSDDELLAVVQRRYQSIPDEIAREPELAKLVLRPLRGDLEAHESYVHLSDAPLAVPITALGGLDDRLVPRTGLEGWSQHTSERFAMHVMPGGHFFHIAQEAEVLGIVASELRATAGQPSAHAHFEASAAR